MHSPSISTRGLANQGGAETCTAKPKTCTASKIQSAITGIIRQKYPNGTKAWAYIAQIFGVKERAAKSRLANDTSYTIEELQALIQGDDGLEYLEALMADAEPEWWGWARWAIEQGRLKRLAAVATQQSLQMESQLPMSPARNKGNPHVKKLNAALSRGQTALGFLDPNNRSAMAGVVAAPAGQVKTAARGIRR